MQLNLFCAAYLFVVHIIKDTMECLQMNIMDYYKNQEIAISCKTVYSMLNLVSSGGPRFVKLATEVSLICALLRGNYQ